mmetsp:Transcript_4110/g.11094  ORF Transcript_4110/g.11094 Transcript_4110/m.11094 type:complete len:653 (-) Transcript_4110:52-2010(-)
MPPKASKKRPAAPDDESNRFVKRIAQHLREASDVAKKRGDDFGWDEARIGRAFDDAVTHMPPGAVRDHLRAHLDVLRTLAVEMFFRPEPTDFPGLGEPGGPDDRDFRERKKPYRDDFGNMSLAELVEETDRCLLKAKCEIPVQFVGDATECLNWEKGKEGRLERCVDAAWATCERWRDESKTPDDSGKTPEAIEELSELMERIATHCAARVRLGTEAEDPELRRCVTEKTHECAARVVLIRHKFRRATPKEKRPKENGFWTRTACHDAAQLCGDTRWRLVYQLAMEIPEDVGVEPADVETGASGEGKRKKSRRNVVGRFGCNDQALFDAALGLSGFDEEFEAKAAAEGISTFADVNAARVTGAIGPALLPPFTFDPALAAADVEAGKPEASLTDVCMAYEKALRGDDWDFMEDSDDEGDVDKDGFNEDEDEMRHLDHYIAFLRVVRGAAALKKAGGDLRGAEDLCRFAGRAPAPSLMLMNLPNDGSVQVSEARATSVELAAADGALWAAAMEARAASARLLGDSITENPEELKMLSERKESFFVDLTPAGAMSEASRAAELAEKLADREAEGGKANDGGLSKEEEEELVGLLKKNKRWLGGGGSDDEDGDDDGDEGILANLAAEDDQLPEELRPDAVDKLEAELKAAEAVTK